MSLVENINRRKKKGISRSKNNSTISKKNYDNMKNYKGGGMISCPCNLKNQYD